VTRARGFKSMAAVPRSGEWYRRKWKRTRVTSRIEKSDRHGGLRRWLHLARQRTAPRGSLIGRDSPRPRETILRGLYPGPRAPTSARANELFRHRGAAKSPFVYRHSMAGGFPATSIAGRWEGSRSFFQVKGPRKNPIVGERGSGRARVGDSVFGAHPRGRKHPGSRSGRPAEPVLVPSRPIRARPLKRATSTDIGSIQACSIVRNAEGAKSRRACV